MFVVTRVMLVTQDVEYALQVRQLEMRGEFIVSAFTSTANAVEFLRVHPQHAVIIDLDNIDRGGVDLIRQMRKIQPDIAVIIAPASTTVQQRLSDRHVQAFIDLPLPLRELVTVVRDAVREMMDALPDTVSAAPMDVDEGETPIPPQQPEADSDDDLSPTQGFEVLFRDDEDGETQIELSPQRSPVDIFEQLAREEPPLPGVEEGGTVSDLMRRVQGGDTPPKPAASQADTPPPPPTFEMPEDAEKTPATTPGEPAELDEPDEDSRRFPATVILEQASDDTPPGEEFSLSKFLNNVNHMLTDYDRRVLPLPAWIKEEERYIREPDFLMSYDPDDIDSQEYTSSVTQPSQSQRVEDQPGSLTTEPIVPVRKSRPKSEPPASLPEVDDKADTPVKPMPAAEEEPAVLEEPAAPDQPAEEADPEAVPAPLDEAAAQIPYTQFDEENPRTEQLALTLTQMALELTADATLLVRDNEIFAYAGNLPVEDLEEIEAQIHGDWAEQDQQARIRFTHLQSTGEDYMLYTRRTAQGDTLAMIFGGDLPMGNIRRQGKRLLDALALVPDAKTAELDIQFDVEETPETDAGPLRAYTYVWVTQDATEAMPKRTRKAIDKGLRLKMERLGWALHEMDVQEDYVYIFADVPSNPSPHERISNLMSSASDYARQVDSAQANGNLWASGYLVLSPGRQMSPEEVQQFIRFARG